MHTKQLSTNSWLQRHYHRVPWKEDKVPYKDMLRIIMYVCTMSTVSYVKGLEKVKFLREYNRHVAVIGLTISREAPLVPQSVTHSIKYSVPHLTNTTLNCAVSRILFYSSWLRQENLVSGINVQLSFHFVSQTLAHIVTIKLCWLCLCVSST